MHPMERLRSVARAEGAGPGRVAREAAGALTGLGGDTMSLVTACRRLIERHPAAGPVWWLASRVLCSSDPVDEAWRAAAELEADCTSAALAAALGEESTVVLVGWPEQAVDGVGRRGDIHVLLVSSEGESSGLSRRLAAAGTQVQDVSDAGLAAAVAGSDVVVLEATALGPGRFVAAPGSHAAAAVAHEAGVSVWLVAGVGRAVPARLWASLEASLEGSTTPPWERDHEFVSIALCDVIVGHEGPNSVRNGPPPSECPVAPELLRPSF